MSTDQQNADGQGAAAPAATGADAPAKKQFKTVFINRFQMETPLANSRGDLSSNLSWGSYRGNPRIIVRTNDPADSENNYGRIIAAMDIGTFEYLAERIIFASTAEPGFKEKLVNKSTYKGGQKFDQPETVNSTLIGKDQDGRVWISVVEDSRPAPRFFFGPSKFHHVVRADGTPLPDNEASCHFARCTMAALKGIMHSLAARAALGDEEGADDHHEPVKTGGGGQAAGQGGGWNRGGGGGNWQGNRGGQGGGWQNRQGGGWQGNRNGGGGGGWNRGGQGGGGWQNRNNQGGGGNGGGNWQAQKQQQAAAAVSDDDISF